MSRKTTAVISLDLWERIHNLKKSPTDTTLIILEEAITLLEKRREQ